MSTEQLEPPKMNITLPKLKSEELGCLVATSSHYEAKFPVFSSWLDEAVNEEFQRRDDELIEAEMKPLPAWTGNELAECLMASYVLCRMPMPEAVHQFFEEVHRHIVGASASALQHFLGEQVI